MSTFSPDDWKRFRKYFISDIGKNSDAQRLLDYLYKHQKKWPDKWSTENVHNRHFSHISKKSFLNLMSVIYGRVENWFILEALEKKKLSRELLLIGELDDRGLYHLINLKVPHIERRFTAPRENQIQDKELATSFYHALYFSDNPIKQHRSDLLYKLAEHFHQSVSEKSILYRTEIMNWEGIYGQRDHQSKHFLDQVIEISDLPSSHYLRLMYKMISSDDFDSFRQLKEYTMTNQWHERSQIHQVLVIYLIRWCMVFWHKGRNHRPGIGY